MLLKALMLAGLEQMFAVMKEHGGQWNNMAQLCGFNYILENSGGLQHKNAQYYQLAIKAKRVGRINKLLFFFFDINKIYRVVTRLILGSIYITLGRCPIRCNHIRDI